MLSLRNIHKTFYQGGHAYPALTDINFDLVAGQSLGLVGASGAGKSTLIRLINLLERPSQGSIIFQGKEIQDYSEKQMTPIRRQMGMIFQHFNLLSTHTAQRNVALPLILAGVKQDKAMQQAADALAMVGLSDKMAHFPSQLSGGQSQRVAIARALIHQPVLLLCDEATSALDPTTTESILELLKQLQKQLHFAMVVVAHDMDVIEYLCDRSCILDGGCIIEQNETFEIFLRPQTTVAKDLVRKVVDHDFSRALSDIECHSQYQLGRKMLLELMIFEQTDQPILSHLMQTHQIAASILMGHRNKISQRFFGHLIISIDGEPTTVEKTLDFLSHYNMKVREIGYVDK
jgi:D-methionine transport system ATP-binding protein